MPCSKLKTSKMKTHRIKNCSKNVHNYLVIIGPWHKMSGFFYQIRKWLCENNIHVTKFDLGVESQLEDGCLQMEIVGRMCKTCLKEIT